LAESPTSRRDVRGNREARRGRKKRRIGEWHLGWNRLLGETSSREGEEENRWREARVLGEDDEVRSATLPFSNSYLLCGTAGWEMMAGDGVRLEMG